MPLSTFFQVSIIGYIFFPTFFVLCFACLVCYNHERTLNLMKTEKDSCCLLRSYFDAI